MQSNPWLKLLSDALLVAIPNSSYEAPGAIQTMLSFSTVHCVNIHNGICFSLVREYLSDSHCTQVGFQQRVSVKQVAGLDMDL